MAEVNNTIKKLAELKDAAVFERLATAYLRASDPNKFKETSHLGVNPKGSTVKAPLDGFSTYEENGVLGIAGLEHTTSDIKKLHDKFLKDLTKVIPKDPDKGPTGTEGDLRKAIKVINGFRAEYSEIKFGTVALVSTLDPKPETILEAKSLAKSNNIELEVHGGTRIADYLDTTAEGQYLRKLFLEKAPEKLSFTLLKVICESQLRNHSFRQLKHLMVPRLNKDHDTKKHVFLVGDSGVGKSIIAYQMLLTNIENGSAGIILSEKFIEESISLEEAITKQLIVYEGELDIDSGATALKLCAPAKPLRVIVEDINNSINPSKSLQKLLSWIPLDDEVNWQLVCPIYPTYIDSIKYEDKKKISTFVKNVYNYTRQEAFDAAKLKSLARGVNISDVEIRSICSSLGNDPLLIALSDLGQTVDSSSVIQNYIDEDIVKVANSFDDIYEYEIEELYSDLLKFMLLNRNFSPSINEVVCWFNKTGHNTNSLKRILKRSSTIFISSINEKNCLSFRHDRIGLTIASNVIINSFDLPEEVEYLSDPYYAEAIGLALVKSNFKRDVIDYLKANNPISLFHAFKLSTQHDSADNPYLRDQIRNWIISTNNEKKANEYLTFEAIKILSRTDSNSVIELCLSFEGCERNEYWLEASTSDHKYV